MSLIKNKEGKISNVKLGAWLGFFAAVLITIQNIVGGDLTWMTAIPIFLGEFAGLRTIIGIRDIPFLNMFIKR